MDGLDLRKEHDRKEGCELASCHFTGPEFALIHEIDAGAKGSECSTFVLME